MIKYFFFCLVFLTACGETETPKKPRMDWNSKKSSDFNRELAAEEELQIKLFLAQHANWKMIKTGSGLQYTIYQEGKGESAKAGYTAEVEIAVSLLDGTKCYQTNADEYQEFVIDKSEIESGIQEGIKKMKIGDKAKLIIPSHLAHGLIGDQDKIPPLTVIVVDIHLIGLKK